MSHQAGRTGCSLCQTWPGLWVGFLARPLQEKKPFLTEFRSEQAWVVFQAEELVQTRLLLLFLAVERITAEGELEGPPGCSAALDAGGSLKSINKKVPEPLRK